jgi:flagellar basal body-associated protein FliL
MSNRENQDRKSGSFSLFTIAVVALAICAAALMLMPAHAGSDASTDSTKVSAASTDANAIAVIQAAAGDAGYLPALYENHAKDVEPVRATY